MCQINRTIVAQLTVVFFQNTESRAITKNCRLKWFWHVKRCGKLASIYLINRKHCLKGENPEKIKFSKRFRTWATRGKHLLKWKANKESRQLRWFGVQFFKGVRIRFYFKRTAQKSPALSSAFETVPKRKQFSEHQSQFIVKYCRF